MSHVTQVPCSRCGSPVMIAPNVGVAACPRCNTQNFQQAQQAAYGQLGYPAAPGQAAAQASGYPHGGPYAPSSPPHAPQLHPPQPASGPFAGSPFAGAAGAIGGVSKKKLVAGAIAMAIVGVGVTAGKGYIKGKQPVKGRASLAALGVDNAKAVEPGRLIEAVRGLARSWKRDAEFNAVIIHGLRSDGTVDLTAKDAVITVTYYSPAGVTALSPKQREDSVKKFSFHADYVTYSGVWGATNRWEGAAPTPVPTCPVATVAAKIPAGKTGSLVLDPNFGTFFNLQVEGQNPTFFEIEGCKEIQP